MICAFPEMLVYPGTVVSMQVSWVSVHLLVMSIMISGNFMCELNLFVFRYVQINLVCFKPDSTGSV